MGPGSFLVRLQVAHEATGAGTMVEFGGEWEKYFFCYLLKLSCLWLRYLLQDQIIGRGGGEIIASMDNRSWAMKSLSLIQITLLILGVVAIGSLSTRFTMQTVMSDGFANFIQIKEQDGSSAITANGLLGPIGMLRRSGSAIMPK